jgi:hypothetical protein
VGHVACIGDIRNVYKILFQQPEDSIPFGILRCTCEDNIKVDLKEIRCKVVDWIYLTQVRVLWQAFVNTVMNLWAP